MQRYVLILVWMLILVVILLSTPTKCVTKEGFFTHYGYYKNYCPSCGWRSRYSCSKCTNCGYCVTASGKGECVPGDSSGPYFRSDCAYWEYNDPYLYYPNSHLYPVVQTRGIYPTVRHRRNSPWKWSKKL